MHNSKAISRLLFKFLQGNLTEKEQLKLEEWSQSSDENRKFLEQLSAEAKVGAAPLVGVSEERHLEQRIFNKISPRVPELQGRVVHMKNAWWKYAAAAAVLALVVNGIWLMQKKEPVAIARVIKKTEPHDVAAPEVSYANITLANGEKVDLNGSSNGMLAAQGKIQVIKLADGSIVYKAATGKANREMQFNTLTNPKGSNVISMVLEDGTKVWLNAESSLTYPVAFLGKERKVMITGEAYFEVAKNKAMPFRITRGAMEVEVLGTHFNVNAYGGEPDMKVTLLEGSVKVSSGNVSGMLKPGQQAKVKDNDIRVQSDINTDQVMAWKNGYFSFERAGVQEVMRELARWYNVEIKYDGAIPNENFGGELRRNSRLSSVLKVLEKSGVKFRIEENAVIVFK